MKQQNATQKISLHGFCTSKNQDVKLSNKFYYELLPLPTSLFNSNEEAHRNHPSCWILWKLINHQPCKKLRAILLMVDHWFIVSIRQKRKEWLILPREYLLQFKKVLKPLMFILSLINTENIASNQAHARQGYNHWECLIFLKVKSCKLYNNKDLIT